MYSPDKQLIGMEYEIPLGHTHLIRPQAVLSFDLVSRM